MPWNNQNGGGRPGGRGPWGEGPGGSSGGGQPPDLEELLRRSQDRLKKLFPASMQSRFGGGGALIIGLVVVIAWLASGVYIVQSNEAGVVTRFGRYVGQTRSGLNYHLPWPIESAYTPIVTEAQQVNIGFVDSRGTRGDVPEESLMLTGDENIIDVHVSVQFIVKDAAAYLFNVANPDNQPDATIKQVAESAMREAVGQNQFELIVTQNREAIQTQVQTLMQQMLDAYGAGVTVTQVALQKADPPMQVLDAYRDVQAARTDQDRMRNEAEAYANNVVPVARGEAAKIRQDAEGYKQQVIAEAQGEAARFVSVLTQYKKAPAVTRRRIYIETMQNVLSKMRKIIIDNKQGSGVVPYLPLNDLSAAPRSGGQP